jgi:KTSC domain
MGLEATPLDRIDFDSQALAWVRYIESQQVLRIGLRTGRVYDYFHVPESIYQALVAAPSQGVYYNSHIRNDFLCRQVHIRTAN